MAQQGEETDRNRWRWPQFSLLELFAAITVLSVFWRFLALRLEPDELDPEMIGSLVLVWGLVCLRTVRLNQHFLRIQRRSDAASNGKESAAGRWRRRAASRRRST